jgi:hypothetical protein
MEILALHVHLGTSYRVVNAILALLDARAAHHQRSVLGAYLLIF